VDDEHGININLDGDDEWDCESGEIDFGDAPDWVKRRLTPERVKALCEQFKSKSGQKVIFDKLIDNIPMALIVLIPLMALVLKALYPLSRRYFVEHLLFFVHFHAFFFLILILLNLFSGATKLLNIDGTITNLVIVAGAFYVPVYLYMGMRRVYGQGRFVTFIKYIALLFAYACGTLLTMLGAALSAVIWIGT